MHWCTTFFRQPSPMKKTKTKKGATSRQNERYNVYLTVSLLKDDCAHEHVLCEGDAFDLSAK